MLKDIREILKDIWGYSAFRPLQEDIINSILNGKDTLALLPTGGGKSICFQVPALAGEGLCLVVSPLIALMKDQVQNLRKRNITAFAIHSGMNRKEVMHSLEVAGSSNCKFLYVSPERLETKLFLEYLPSLNVKLIAVDEAHCISQWGYDFRPPYLRISALRDELPGVAVLALTASATVDVQNDICEKLKFKNGTVFRQTFERKNLSYSAFRTDSKINRITEILKNVSGTAIVYCKTRRRTKEISELLTMHGISSDYYHAGLSSEQRNEKQEAWIRNEIRVVVCTNAFGMGIDKPDVRIVVHAGMPECIENYYQEAGRAGRDGKKAYAVLLYSEKDIAEMKKNAASSFPPLEQIRLIYQALMNYLQIPAGIGEGISYDFDINSFIKKFSLEARVAAASLKALEQDGWIQINESVFIPSKIQFLASRERLQALEDSSHDLDALVKCLLRTYEGIYDYPVSVNESSVAFLTGNEIEKVKRDLTGLHAASIINYIPRTDSPQIVFLQNRVPAKDLRLNEKEYKKRKLNHEARLAKMLEFVKSSSCRSKYIGNYFGDTQIGNCGICDNCLRRKKNPLTEKEFNLIHTAIVNMLDGKSVPSEKLLSDLKVYEQKKVFEVLNFLQSENKICISGLGEISLK